MNLVLLSGGSGKRLWPLSNEIRSKQFIRLFRSEEGRRISMLERVYGQIRSAAPSARVLIATSRTQVPAIHNQIGSEIPICVEPSRRDTFPAMALSAAYLHDRLSVPKDEPVAFCPIDPYVHSDYFTAIDGLERLVREDTHPLTLLGIQPVCPSEKYGYIIPVDQNEVSEVRAFREKPDLATARKYIAEGALWNAGVFAFRLGFLLRLAGERLGYERYEELYRHYDELPKISFDYAVVEKEPKIRVVRYRGEWKDVGTWNMITEVMSDRTIGPAVLDEETTDTNVINELDLPVLVMGARNMVVAISNDGILVADKERSGYMKPYVDRLHTDARYADKEWGSYTVIDLGKSYMTVRICMRSGCGMSYHAHAFRDETWTVLTGHGYAVVDGVRTETGPGSTISIRAGMKHTLFAETEMTVLETQLGDSISESDKTKYDF